jgi:hypothetical protein
MVLIAMICSTEVSKGAKPSEKFLWLSNPYWRVGAINDPGLDAAGFSDKFYWGASPPSLRHAAAYEHEMLSGEWAAAIYYDGIATGAEAMWLTDKFFLPDWTTNSQFIIDSDPVSSDNVNNPVVGLDTGYSRIKNAQVQITIDYEMVDLGEGGSPMAFGSLVGADAFVYSEQYVLLQTYTITNRTDSPIENLEFYQMLHGHPADPVLQDPVDQVNPVVFSVYDSTDHPDPLEDYEPWNDVHREEGSIYAGNFRYDITQWNNSDDPDKHTAVDHRDWIGFSSTVPPDFLENGYYVGGHSETPNNKPPRPDPPDPPGTHWNIEDRVLNEKTHSFGEVAGAMGWSLGALDAEGGENDSVKLTLAVMFGSWPIQRSCGELEAEAHWGLDEATGDVAHDWIGDNDGTLVGDPEWVYGGYIGGALEFDGDGDYVELSHPVGALTGESVTISAWVKPGLQMLASGAYDILSQTKESPGYWFGYQLYLDVLPSGACRPAFSLNYPYCYARSDDAIARNEWA